MLPAITPAIRLMPPARRALAALAALALAAAMVLSAPLSALALDTAKCTARPNGNTGSEVYGGCETRLTWEGQADDDEPVAGLDVVAREQFSRPAPRSRRTMRASRCCRARS